MTSAIRPSCRRALKANRLMLLGECPWGSRGREADGDVA
jgi:hypothetical protein